MSFLFCLSSMVSQWIGIQYFNHGGVAGIHHSKYWMPIHYDTIEDGKTKKSHLQNLPPYFTVVPALQH